MSIRGLPRGAPRTAPGNVTVTLALGLLPLGFFFVGEVSAAVQTWVGSTAYTHCFLVIPIVAFLLWDRRNDLAGLTPAPAPWLALLGIPVAAIWLLAERLGIMEGRQLAAVSFVELLFLVVLGPRLWRAAAGPLLYLYFLVPFGAFLTPWLQDITTLFIRHGLGLLRIPAYIDGYFIEIPQGTFLVAEACAGLRFLIASIAFGSLYALMMYRGAVRRAAFIAVSIITPIVANGLRALGIVYLGYRLNSAEAAAADHLIYGWIFFSAVILLLTVLGLPFRQDHIALPPRLPVPLVPAQRSTMTAALALVVIAGVGPVMAVGLAMAEAPPLQLPAAIEVGPNCTSRPGVMSGAALRSQRVVCSGIAMDMVWEVFSTRATAAAVMQERRRLSRSAAAEQVIEDWLPDFADQHRAWRIMRAGDPAYTLATSIWIDGRPMRPGLAMRLRMAMHSVFGSAFAPVLMVVTPAVAWETLTPAERRQADAVVATFLQAYPELDTRVGALSAVR